MMSLMTAKGIDRLVGMLLLLAGFSASYAQHHEIKSDNIASLQVVANNDWQGDAVIGLGTTDRLYISFDDLTHQYRRFSYTLTHCEPDWTDSEGLFTSDFMSGFQGDVSLEDYEESVNTNQLYTHYSLTIPNSNCRPKISGNYRLDIIDDESNDTMLVVRFLVSEDVCNVSKTIRTDTDIDIRKGHQQLDLSIDYPSTLNVTDPREQFRVLVQQNHRTDNQVWLKSAPVVRNGILEWPHEQCLIFPAGNEFHKFEMLDVHRNSMGVESLSWDGESYNAYLYHDYPRRAYVYDQDADGAYILRNSENSESTTTSEYVKVHFYLDTPKLDGDVYVDGKWATNHMSDKYLMQYDEEHHWYHVDIPLKYGYYSYEYILQPSSNTNHLTFTSDTEGDFYQTENRYQVYVYYKASGDRTWRLVAAK